VNCSSCSPAVLLFQLPQHFRRPGEYAQILVAKPGKFSDRGSAFRFIQTAVEEGGQEISVHVDLRLSVAKTRPRIQVCAQPLDVGAFRNAEPRPFPRRARCQDIQGNFPKHQDPTATATRRGESPWFPKLPSSTLFHPTASWWV
jgi:hypothetical protein